MCLMICLLASILSSASRWLTLQWCIWGDAPFADGLQRPIQEMDAGRIARIPVLLQDLLAHAVQHPAALYAGDPLCACPGTQQRRERTASAHHKHMCACTAHEDMMPMALQFWHILADRPFLISYLTGVSQASSSLLFQHSRYRNICARNYLRSLLGEVNNSLPGCSSRAALMPSSKASMYVVSCSWESIALG